MDFSLSSPALWAGLGNIILVNIVLSGDGDMMATDPAIAAWFAQAFPHNHLVIVPGTVEFAITGLLGAAFVWLAGTLLNRRAAARRAEAGAVSH